MRLVCPHCAAAYEVPPALLGRRRTVRCVRCGRDWVEHGARPGDTDAAGARAGASADAAEARAPAPLGMVARARMAALRGSAAPLRLAWAASVLVLVIGTWEAVAWRTAVMRAWPPSQRLYGGLGLARDDHANGMGGRPATSPPGPRRQGEKQTVPR